MKEAIFQLIGKPKINKFLYETNKNFEFSEAELPIEVNNDIQVMRGSDDHKQEAVVILNIGIFTMKDFESVPFKINAEIEGYFKWDEELENNNPILESMLKENAPAILYSYVRPIITLITVEANMPPLIIPLLNFKD